VITSTRHPLVLTFRRLGDHPRRDPLRVLLDGPHLVTDALDAGVIIETALVATGTTENRLAPIVARLHEAGVHVHAASPRVVQAAGRVVTSQGIVAVARRPAEADEAILAAPDLLLLVADGIQDPGNLGTMIRTALAAGATAVATVGGTADPLQPKALRASMGAAFRIPIVHAEAPRLRDTLGARGVRILVADPRGAVEFTVAPFDPPVAIVIGNEAGGPDPAWTPAGLPVRIPLYGPVESLNAAVAAAVLLYEAARRRAGEPRR
jgi:TrmH family RNA methyltransferase